MSVTTTGSPPSFFKGEYWKFTVAIRKDGSGPDISSDVVTATVKNPRSESDAAADMQFDADVATSGATGTAIFERSAVQTGVLDAQVYHMDIWWYPTDDEDHPLYNGDVRVKARVSDVP